MAAPAAPCSASRSLADGALLLVVVSLLAAAPAAGEEPPAPALPPGTDIYAGAPPYLPAAPNDAHALRAWCERVTQCGRELAGTRRGADLLYAAGHARLVRLRETGPALALLAEAAAAYPPGDPMQAMAQYHRARWEIARGNAEVAAALLEKLEAWARVRAPADLEPAEALRWALLADLAAERLPRLRAQVAQAHGRFTQAAAIHEDLALAAAQSGRPAEAADLWESAARLHHRAGDRPAARRAVDEVLALEQPASERAWIELWRVFLDHGLLRPDGSLGLWSTWPGETFERDVMGALRGLQGHENAGRLYLSIASGAFTAGRKAFALDVYELALGDRILQEQARHDANLWRGLLVAFPAALDLERLDLAEHLLGVVERIADEPIEEVDEYRAAIVEARRRRAGRARREAAERAGARARARTSGPGRRALGRMESGEPGRGAAAADEPAATRDECLPTGVWIAGLGLALLGLLVLVRSRRQRPLDPPA